MTTKKQTPATADRLPLWLISLIPLVALALMLSVFAFGDPLSVFKADLPPIEDLAFESIRVTRSGFEAVLVNGGPDPLTVAQVLVDDAYWQFEIDPSPVIPRLGRATLRIAYPWVRGEPHTVRVLTSTGLTFDGEVPVATLTPTPGVREFAAYGLLGVYVGIIPVALGMLWFPAMKRLGRRWMGGVLALTLGLLAFLLVDTLLEAFEVADTLPGVFQGVPLALFAALLAWLGLLAISSTRARRAEADVKRRGVELAGLIALGIGLHNLGEGIAIGTAFALGEAALGSFLVIGFTLHNITEGVGIAAPLLPVVKATAEVGASNASPRRESPGLAIFIALALLAGAPAILGAWIGGFAFSPLLAVLFLGIGAGAIWQVIVEVGALLREYAQQEGVSLTAWINVGGFLAGLAIMYFTAFLVKF